MPAGSAAPVSATTHYRPHLDGLRAVAVFLVVAFHAGLGVFSGGYIGVDVFFVLSGYLVTGILVRDLARSGEIRRGRFYARRVRRILPASAVTLVVTAIVYTAIVSPVEALDALGAFRAAFLYVANWFFIHQSTDYFAANVDTNPVLHFWSLAVEEQFYLVWPLLLAGLWALVRRPRHARLFRARWWVLRIVIVAAGVASALLALHLSHTQLSRAYYGTDTRAYQLLAGAALALTPQLVRRGSRGARGVGWLGALLLAGLVVIGTSLVDVGPIGRGVIVAALVLVLLAALERADTGPAARVLGAAPFVFLGQISYGIYLWHWPIIVVAQHGRTIEPIAMFVIAATLATLLAAVSYRLLERPIRAARALNRFAIPVVATGLGASLLLGIVVMPAILDTGSTTVAAGRTGSASGLRLLDWRKAKTDFVPRPDCVHAPVSRCTVVHGTGRKVVLMGDSDAWMWLPTLRTIAQRRNWQLSALVFPTCPWQRELQGLVPERFPCAEEQTDWYTRVIPALDPDLVILAHQSFDDPRRPYAFVGPGGEAAFARSPRVEPILLAASSGALAQLRKPGRSILVFEPAPDPAPGYDPLSCLSTGTAVRRCAYDAYPGVTPLVAFYREQAGAGVATIDLRRVVCPRFPRCDAVVGNVIVKRDQNHLTETFARSVVGKVDALLTRAGVDGPG